MKTKPVNLIPIEDKWYCWFCESEIPAEKVFMQIDKDSRRYRQPVYVTSWGSIHSARKEHYNTQRNY